jgi:hypothetical protein
MSYIASEVSRIRQEKLDELNKKNKSILSEQAIKEARETRQKLDSIDVREKEVADVLKESSRRLGDLLIENHPDQFEEDNLRQLSDEIERYDICQGDLKLDKVRFNDVSPFKISFLSVTLPVNLTKYAQLFHIVSQNRELRLTLPELFSSYYPDGLKIGRYAIVLKGKTRVERYERVQHPKGYLIVERMNVGGLLIETNFDNLGKSLVISYPSRLAQSVDSLALALEKSLEPTYTKVKSQ